MWGFYSIKKTHLIHNILCHLRASKIHFNIWKQFENVFKPIHVDDDKFAVMKHEYIFWSQLMLYSMTSCGS